ncbi:NAD-dependent protein deacetylase sirtuin-3, mitochondrial isoform X1 [Protopterus annectens]|uniref:NAD-dependent protein deacetylase sirtuin-3, mitochondrial isoform X1 n=1 Tax=Protopterus annectens TaxID=7888 RepID=UPI001CF9D0F3|nr:NAD-dependent protein deacetylase sirtuin-3, mitochondrial isoform X1 [Protopterus annectens]
MSPSVLGFLRAAFKTHFCTLWRDWCTHKVYNRVHESCIWFKKATQPSLMDYMHSNQVKIALCKGSHLRITGIRHNSVNEAHQWKNRNQHARHFSVSSSALISFGKAGGSREKHVSLQDVAELVKNKQCTRIVVMAGAGISTPSGIPDFRSPESGLYHNLQKYDLPYPEAIFEIDYFLHNPKPFFTLAKELYPGNYKPNYAHYFIRLLQDKGLLLRMYTQNIDALERVAGIDPSKLVEAHGTFATATCTVCYRKYKGEDFYTDIMNEKIPQCFVCTGIVKPDIIFFGEQLPQRFFMYMTDFPLADLLIVIGSSLEVEPFASLVGAVRSSVPRVLFNRDPVGPFAFQTHRRNDVAELDDIIVGVEKFADLLGWKEELKNLIDKETEKLDLEKSKK